MKANGPENPLIDQASIALIRESSLSAAAEIRKNSPQYATEMQKLWSIVEAQTILESDGRYSYPWQTMHDFYIRGAGIQGRFITATPEGRQFNDLSKGITRAGIWRRLYSYIRHDLQSINTWGLYWHIYVLLEKSYCEKERGFIHPEHFDYLRNLVQRSKEVAIFHAYPYEMLATMMDATQGHNISKELSSSYEIIDSITFILKGISHDDYKISSIAEASDFQHRNRLIIDVDKDQVLYTNKALLFSIIHNFGINAMRALLKFHGLHNDLALDHLYEDKQPLKYPMAIRFSVKERTDDVIITVDDEGPGILKLSVGENIFDHLPEDSAYDQPRDHGLGLKITKYVTELLGGTVDGHNKPEGGAQFSICLPKSAVGLA